MVDETRVSREYDYRAGGTDVYGSIVKRTSWGAIFAGMVVALVVELALNVLGLGIGLGVVNPATEQTPFAGVGIGAGIWFVISTIIALFAGGWVAGRLSGFPRTLTGTLHGLVVWGLVTLLSFYFMTTAVGMLISGVAGVIGRSLSLVASGIQTVAPQAMQQDQQEAQQRGVTLDTITQQGRQLLGQGGAVTEQQNQELGQALQRLFANPQQPSAQDRETVVSILVQRSNMSRPDAEARVDQWINQYYQARQGALQTTEQAFGAMSKAAIWAFIGMILGAIAAGFGGALGSPREPLPLAR
ncbi:MAG: hypothetical protein ABFD62_19225 [Syntrophaceae bacterium]